MICLTKILLALAISEAAFASGEAGKQGGNGTINANYNYSTKVDHVMLMLQLL